MVLHLKKRLDFAEAGLGGVSKISLKWKPILKIKPKYKTFNFYEVERAPEKYRLG